VAGVGREQGSPFVAFRATNVSGRVLLLNKPFGVVCQFSPSPGHETLADYVHVPSIYPAGRLDADSEGLVVLTDDGALQHRISAPDSGTVKVYWVQVEGIPEGSALASIRRGVDLGDYVSKPAEVCAITEPAGLWLRTPPIRYRAHIPTSWLEIGLREGKNRQIRRMTARVGHPTLRLVRAAVGPWTLGDLRPGEHRWDAAPAAAGRVRSDSTARGRGARRTVAERTTDLLTRKVP
jgi:23S rRNA pseudouridine2457 synthase